MAYVYITIIGQTDFARRAVLFALFYLPAYVGIPVLLIIEVYLEFRTDGCTAWQAGTTV